MSYGNLNSESLRSSMDSQVKYIENIANSLRDENSDARGILIRNLTEAQAKLQAMSAEYQGAVIKENLKNSILQNNIIHKNTNKTNYQDISVPKNVEIKLLIGTLIALIGGISLPILLCIFL